jgi:HEAT repeat protein
LLQRNANPKATGILLDFLETEEGRMLTMSLDALGRRESKNAEISKAILPFVAHDDPKARVTAVFILNYREYREAYPEILKRLDDPDPLVKCSALSWPWYSYSDKHPEVFSKIRRLARDSNSQVRADACRTLVSIRDLRSFYFLWFTSLLDRSKWVRRSIDLGLLLEGSPVVVGFFLLWPTLAAAAGFLYATKRLGMERRGAVLTVGLVAGYLVGAGCGYLVGEYHADGPFMQALFLTPAICMPVSLAMAFQFVLKKRGRGSGQPSPHTLSDTMCGNK